MVDERRRVAAAARIDAPANVDFADVNLAAFRDATRSFAIADPLTQQLTDLLPRLQAHSREAALPVNARLAYDESLVRSC